MADGVAIDRLRVKNESGQRLGKQRNARARRADSLHQLVRQGRSVRQTPDQGFGIGTFQGIE